MSEKHEVFEKDSIRIFEAGVCDIYDIGSWYTYLDGDEDLVYTFDKTGELSYSYDYIRLSEDGFVAGYSIGYPQNILEGARPGELYEKEYAILDFAVDSEDNSEIHAGLLMEYVMRRAEKYGCDRIVIEKNLPEYIVFYAFIEKFGAKLDNGRYIIELPNTDKEKYRYAIPTIEGQISREISYRLLALGFTLGEKEATHPFLDGTIKVDRLFGDVSFEGVNIFTPEGLNVNNHRDIAMLAYLISCVRDDNDYEYRKTYMLHGKEVLMADVTWGVGYAGLITYADNSEEANKAWSILKSEYSTSLHSLYKAGYNAVMLFSAEYDEKIGLFTERSSMVGVEGELRNAIKQAMRKESGAGILQTLLDKKSSRKSFGAPTRIRLDFGERSAWFIINGKKGLVKLGEKSKELSASEIDNVSRTLNMLSLDDWKESYEGEGEGWLFAVEFEGGESFISKGKGSYPPAFPIALDLYYDFAN